MDLLDIVKDTNRLAHDYDTKKSAAISRVCQGIEVRNSLRRPIDDILRENFGTARDRKQGRIQKRRDTDIVMVVVELVDADCFAKGITDNEPELALVLNEL